MASDKDASVPSDNEGGERPVREQLKKAHIAPQPHSGTMSATIDDDDSSLDGKKDVNTENIMSEETQQEGNVAETRDEVLRDADAEIPRNHTRKRSRDSTAEEDALNNGQRKVSGERSRDGHTEAGKTEHDAEANGTYVTAPGERPATPEVKSEKQLEALGEEVTSPKTKRKRLQSSGAEESSEKETTTASEGTQPKIPANSGFANASAASPFSTLMGDRKSPSAELPQTSSSAFTSSGFGALTGTVSGFSTIGKGSGGFGSGGSFAISGAKPDESVKPAAGSAFGGSLGQKSAFAGTSTNTSGFGSASSGFGKLGQSSSTLGGSGFGNGIGSTGFGSGLGGTGFGSGSGLKSFASKKSTTQFGTNAKPSKPFGAPADEDEEEAEDGGDEDDGAGIRSPLSSTEDDRQDDRFYAQDVETGEEDETTEYTCRAKLYNFVTLPDGKKEWRERGVGVLRLNAKKQPDDPAAGSPKARFLMRADGSHRVVLNTPIQKQIKFGAPNGGKPQGGYMYFMGAVDGAVDGAKLELLQLKMKQEFALQLYERIAELQAVM